MNWSFFFVTTGRKLYFGLKFNNNYVGLMKLLISYVNIAQSIAVIIFHGAESITILKQQYHLSKIAILTKIFNHSYANKKKKAKFIFSLICSSPVDSNS